MKTRGDFYDNVVIELYTDKSFGIKTGASFSFSKQGNSFDMIAAGLAFSQINGELYIGG